MIATTYGYVYVAQIAMGADQAQQMCIRDRIKDIYESRLQLERSSKATMELAQLQYINGVIGCLDVLDEMCIRDRPIAIWATYT